MKRIILLGLVVGLLFLVACTQSISEVKSSDYVDKKVTVRGEVTDTFKLGELSGYWLTEDEESIFVASSNLPKEGNTITVSGVIKKGPLGIGYYLEN